MKHKAWISTIALQRIADDAHRWFPSETGGTLLGYWTRSTEVVIMQCTSAGPRAHHSGALYKPDPDHDERAIAEHYQASGRLHTYLGDWHTHPRHGAYMSTKDASTLHQIALEPGARMRTPVMLIAGGGPAQWYPKIWCYRRFLGRKRFLPMIVREFQTDL